MVEYVASPEDECVALASTTAVPAPVVERRWSGTSLLLLSVSAVPPPAMDFFNGSRSRCVATSEWRLSTLLPRSPCGSSMWLPHQ